MSSPALTIQRFNDSTNYVATARVLLRDVSKIFFPNNPVNVPVIRLAEICCLTPIPPGRMT